MAKRKKVGPNYVTMHLIRKGVARDTALEAVERQLLEARAILTEADIERAAKRDGESKTVTAHSETDPNKSVG